MSSTKLLVALLVFAAPAIATAQYDFDDFIDAVESGQSKSAPSSLETARLAELPNGSGAAMTAGSSALQPILSETPVPLEPMPFSMLESPLPNQVNFEELFEQQDTGLADPAMHCSCNSNKADCHQCRHTAKSRQCSVLPYQTPELPAPSSLRGYFNASPCIANVWDGYACEATARCAETQQSIAGTHGKQHNCRHSKEPCE